MLHCVGKCITIKGRQTTSCTNLYTNLYHPENVYLCYLILTVIIYLHCYSFTNKMYSQIANCMHSSVVVLTKMIPIKDISHSNYHNRLPSSTLKTINLSRNNE